MWLEEVGMWQAFNLCYKNHKVAVPLGEHLDVARRAAFKEMFGIEMPGVGNKLYETLQDLATTRKCMQDAINQHNGKTVVHPKPGRTLEMNKDEYQFQQKQKALAVERAEKAAAEVETITEPVDDCVARVNSLPEKEAALDSEILPPATRPTGPVSYRDILEWVARNLSREDITPDNVPDPMAFELWEAYHGPSLRPQFFALYHKAANLAEDGERDAKADDRKLLGRLEGIKKKVVAAIKRDREELNV
jgi:hypothetical protein